MKYEKLAQLSKSPEFDHLFNEIVKFAKTNELDAKFIQRIICEGLVEVGWFADPDEGEKDFPHPCHDPYYSKKDSEI